MSKYTFIDFLLDIADEIVQASDNNIALGEAKEIASTIWNDFVMSEAKTVEGSLSLPCFGDDDYHWNKEAAIILAREFEIDYWGY